VVSATVASQTVRNSLIAVIIASAGILLYISWAFRGMPKPLRWGTCAVVALVHDVLVTVGIFSILGWTLGVEVDALFITGMLTVVGYSVHDTIVVFDRIRENIAKNPGKDFTTVVNDSILQTLVRSLTTSLLVLFVLLALFMLGGATIHYFTLVLLIGVTTGTYSSVCNASQLLVVWEKGEWRRFISWLPFFPAKKSELPQKTPGASG
jgi:preprotein translocase subunit SecF